MKTQTSGIPTDSAGRPPKPERRSASRAGRTLSFARRHWRGLLRVAVGLLVLTVVLQNMEPTSVDLLVWSVAGVPKLVLILVSMAVGAALWEIARRLLRGATSRER